MLITVGWFFHQTIIIHHWKKGRQKRKEGNDHFIIFKVRLRFSVSVKVIFLIIQIHFRHEDRGRLNLSCIRFLKSFLFRLSDYLWEWYKYGRMRMTVCFIIELWRDFIIIMVRHRLLFFSVSWLIIFVRYPNFGYYSSSTVDIDAFTWVWWHKSKAAGSYYYAAGFHPVWFWSSWK